MYLNVMCYVLIYLTVMGVECIKSSVDTVMLYMDALWIHYAWFNALAVALDRNGSGKRWWVQLTEHFLGRLACRNPSRTISKALPATSGTTIPKGSCYSTMALQWITMVCTGSPYCDTIAVLKMFLLMCYSSLSGPNYVEVFPLFVVT